MITIGATVTRALFEALDSGVVQVDFIKVDADKGLDVTSRALQHAPVLIHDVAYTFWLNYEDPFVPETMQKARELLNAANCPWFSTGIGASAEPQGHTLEYWRGANAEQLQTRERCLANIVRNGLRLKAWLGRMPLLLENYNYHPTNAYEYVCEPDTFSELIRQIDCGVLLDLAHAQISAFNMRWGDPRLYLDALPLDRVREIHVNHPFNDGTQMLDKHLPFDESEVALLAWTVANTPVEAVTLESGSPDVATLQHELDLVRQAVAEGQAQR